MCIEGFTDQLVEWFASHDTIMNYYYCRCWFYSIGSALLLDGRNAATIIIVNPRKCLANSKCRKQKPRLSIRHSADGELDITNPLCPKVPGRNLDPAALPIESIAGHICEATMKRST